MRRFDKIALAITDDEVPLGSHLIHFWKTPEEFETQSEIARLLNQRQGKGDAVQQFVSIQQGNAVIPGLVSDAGLMDLRSLVSDISGVCRKLVRDNTRAQANLAIESANVH